jgi:hypothetical protein
MSFAALRHVLFALFLGVATTAVSAGATAAYAQTGAILTIAGNVENPNRGALEPFADALLNSLDLNFDRARTFDRDALVDIGMSKIVTKYPGSDRTIEVEGPLLRDVLAKAGASGNTVTVTALDGYAVDLPMSDIARWSVILALKSGGEWLDIGGRGPSWIVYPQDDYPELAERDDSNWVWSVFYIRVQ